jgi:hypothetical protein
MDPSGINTYESKPVSLGQEKRIAIYHTLDSVITVLGTREGN